MPRATNPTTDPKPKRLTVNLPPDLHRAFKLYCTEKDVEMSSVILDYVKRCVKRHKRNTP